MTDRGQGYFVYTEWIDDHADQGSRSLGYVFGIPAHVSFHQLQPEQP